MTTYISTRYTCRLYLHLTLYVRAMEPLLTGEVGKALESWRVELGQAAGVDIQRLAVEADRCHFLAEFASQQPISEVVSVLQSASAKLLRQRFPAWFAEVGSVWERGYAARTAGIPYLPLRALMPVATWRPPSDLEGMAQFQTDKTVSLKDLAKSCAQPDGSWR